MPNPAGRRTGRRRGGSRGGSITGMSDCKKPVRTTSQHHPSPDRKQSSPPSSGEGGVDVDRSVSAPSAADHAAATSPHHPGSYRAPQPLRMR
ncbi:hypothetical protein FQA47_011673 [Oryzias melastigma]|uniref:Uncharacterized protein n=1 Tax=Oryzias melastigma TaxID=30732 RepID=A0A834CGN8_ORYME|nr:hypothetical protein FQA47_011673 [Oryzias melastigma]